LAVARFWHYQNYSLLH